MATYLPYFSFVVTFATFLIFLLDHWLFEKMVNQSHNDRAWAINFCHEYPDGCAVVGRHGEACVTAALAMLAKDYKGCV